MANGGVVGSRVYVNKVFSSVARPGIVSVQVPEERAVLSEDPSGNNFDTITPRILVKAGDNLFQDMAVELMFRIFNFVWRQDRELFPDPEKVPFSYTYSVLPTGNRKGIMETLTDVVPLNHYDWAKWVTEKGHSSAVKDLMMRSAAGSFVGAYVLGCRDRHWDNIMLKNECMLLHIDFGFVLGSVPPSKSSFCLSESNASSPVR